MSAFRADLHCHSTCSDGTLSPTELLELAKAKGLQALSITDHDSIDAYTPETEEIAKKLNIELMAGVEFSSAIKQTSVHILGYNFDTSSRELRHFCLWHKNRRTNRYKAILAKLAQIGMPILEKDLLSLAASPSKEKEGSAIGRPHIAQMMVKMGYVSNLPEAFKKYLGDGCSCYVQGEYVSPQKTIAVIHQAGGAAIIAHPHLIKQSEILQQLLKLEFDGIECYYSKFPPQEHERWLRIAKARNWLITGGSDFHGEVKPSIALGSSWVDEEHYSKLKNYRL